MRHGRGEQLLRLLSAALAGRNGGARALRLGRVKPSTTNARLSELHRTWARPDAAALAQLYALVAPNYAAVMDSHVRAQPAVRE